MGGRREAREEIRGMEKHARNIVYEKKIRGKKEAANNGGNGESVL